ncbi:MAG: bifunctional 2-polyprenyl-6-hydroxyphenol methylase/3-demethylubiquinol 3-O-methyltransferase UbiG [Candidatus Hydrogenedentes bacterium]|nr:bifunctional 2-polyprenyl-6-hydroxyphenol methylase/3-demethylubiquinol 3-O-methyltransferase UbiG [Candidatus Hydrogenedentota bacterium]
MNTEKTQEDNFQTNVDPEERRKFEAQANGWWDPDGDFRPLHDLNPARLNYIAEIHPLKNTKTLDIGCGGGILSEAMARDGAKVTAIDIAEKSLKIARLHGLESGVEVDYRCITAEELAQNEAETYQLVTCLEMLEHVPDPASIVRSAAELLAPGGDCFFSTINRTPKAFITAIVGAEHVLRLLPRGTHQYDRFIRPSELSAWIRDAGMEVMDIRGLHYNPLQRTLSRVPRG